MRIAIYFNRLAPFVFKLAVVCVIVVTTAPALAEEAFKSHDPLPFGFSLNALPDRNGVDPQTPITMKALGLGSRLAKVELMDDKGAILFRAVNQASLSLPAPLAFGARYLLKVTAERPWAEQSETRAINFTTVTAPKLEGPVLTMLGPDAAVKLHFDQPVKAVRATGGLTLKAEADATGQNIRLLASNYEQDRKYAVQLNYETATGVPVPPISLELTTPPPLIAKSNIRGLTNLGLKLPLQITFSEPVQSRAHASDSIQVRTREGKPISGKWAWRGPRQFQFTPDPTWPASSIIDVSIDPETIKSQQGGRLEHALIEQFSTGTDRRLFVYLDSQQVEAVENGKVIRTFKVSTGKSKTPTVTGSFYIYDRYRRKTMRSDVEQGQPGFYEVKNVPYTQFFHKDYAFHGAFWHNSFGRPASHGCVNLATKEQNKRWPKVTEDAGWLYQWGALGLPVTVLQKAPAPMQAASRSLAKEDKTVNSEAKPQSAKVADKQALPSKEKEHLGQPI